MITSVQWMANAGTITIRYNSGEEGAISIVPVDADSFSPEQLPAVMLAQLCLQLTEAIIDLRADVDKQRMELVDSMQTTLARKSG
jgi:hypothetical protein